MASVFKLGRDKKRKGAPWYFEYLDHHGKKRMRKGFTDKSLTEQLAVKLETEARLRRMGLVDGEQADLALEKKSGIAKHLEDYERSLTKRKNTTKHVKLTMGRVRRVVEGCDFQTLGDINADAIEALVIELREEEDLGHRTYNHYLQAIEGLCNWLVQKRRLGRNPAVGIPRLNAETDVRHPRRALTPVEFGKLIKSARESSESIQCYSGEERARIYTLSYMTGLRRGELASLTPQSFSLDGSPPTVTIQATISKHRKRDVLPLHPELVPMLREWLLGLLPTDFLFPKLARRRTWLMVKKDLERVGIEYETADGIADFHAAGRHTHITELLRNGASLVQAKELARHSDVKMTMKYTHIGIQDQAQALRGLPAPLSCQDIVRNPAVPACPNGSSAVAECHHEVAGTLAVSPEEMAPYDTNGHKKTPPVTGGVEWRRRESNPRPNFRKYVI
ncbi:tyrosine-type recombinase/integrase [Aeoliella sp. SH292]|uniref:tyrosine-type recombinase/integrase n=1 Tax=Aeoliella sp. SH292 TaxID=3454464 RepID=UPI003F9A9B5A